MSLLSLLWRWYLRHGSRWSHPWSVLENLIYRDCMCKSMLQKPRPGLHIDSPLDILPPLTSWSASRCGIYATAQDPRANSSKHRKPKSRSLSHSTRITTKTHTTLDFLLISRQLLTLSLISLGLQPGKIERKSASFTARECWGNYDVEFITQPRLEIGDIQRRVLHAMFRREKSVWIQMVWREVDFYAFIALVFMLYTSFKNSRLPTWNDYNRRHQRHHDSSMSL
jgi:hypothetical protein